LVSKIKCRALVPSPFTSAQKNKHDDQDDHNSETGDYMNMALYHSTKENAQTRVSQTL